MSEANEVEMLREQLEAYRQRELADLKESLAAARQAAEHYQREAQRLDQVGRAIHAEAQIEINRLKTKLAVYEELETNARRPQSTRG